MSTSKWWNMNIIAHLEMVELEIVYFCVNMLLFSLQFTLGNPTKSSFVTSADDPKFHPAELKFQIRY